MILNIKQIKDFKENAKAVSKYLKKNPNSMSSCKIDITTTSEFDIEEFIDELDTLKERF